jgi:AraC-like DNA-binding protein
MTVRVQAAAEPARQRREFWLQTASAALGSLDLHIMGDVDPADRIVAGRIGPVGVGALTAHGPGGAVRTARQARRTPSDLCKIDLPVDGTGVVEQDGRVARLGPGDFALVDLSRPARWAMSPRRVIAVTFPRALLPVRAADLGRMTAVAVPGDHGVGALVSPLVERLVDGLDEYGPGEAPRLGTAVVDLVAAALGAHVGSTVGPGPLQATIDAFIDDRLPDPGLSPVMVAAATHVSVRALHRMFESRHTTVARWIRQRRLERCRRDLLDAALSARPVSAIGARWGLVNPSHFNRVFRAEYGMPPAAYRHEFNPGAMPRRPE